MADNFLSQLDALDANIPSKNAVSANNAQSDFMSNLDALDANIPAKAQNKSSQADIRKFDKDKADNPKLNKFEQSILGITQGASQGIKDIASTALNYLPTGFISTISGTSPEVVEASRIDFKNALKKQEGEYQSMTPDTGFVPRAIGSIADPIGATAVKLFPKATGIAKLGANVLGRALPNATLGALGTPEEDTFANRAKNAGLGIILGEGINAGGKAIGGIGKLGNKIFNKNNPTSTSINAEGLTDTNNVIDNLQKSIDGDKQANANLLNIVNPDEKVYQASKNLGVDDSLTPEILSKNPKYIEIAQTLKNAGSEGKKIEAENIQKIKERANNLIEELGGNKDLASVNENTKTKIVSTLDELDNNISNLQQKLESSIPDETIAGNSKTLEFLEKKAKRVGGVDKLSTYEKDILDNLSPTISKQAGEQNIQKIKQSIDDIVIGLEAKDSGKLNDDLRNDFVNSRTNLKEQEKGIRDFIDKNVNPSSKVDFSNTKRYIQKRAKELGSFNNLSPAEKEVLKKINNSIVDSQGNIKGNPKQIKAQANYALINEVRTGLNASKYGRATEAYSTNGNDIVRDELILALRKDQVKHLKKISDEKNLAQNIGNNFKIPNPEQRLGKEANPLINLVDQFEKAQGLTIQRKGLEKSGKELFGKNIDSTFIPKLDKSIIELSNGNATNFNRILNNSSLNDDSKREITQNVLSKILQLAKNNDKSYIKFYEGLQKNTQSKNELFKYFGETSKNKLDDIYSLLKSQEAIKNGKFDNNIISRSKSLGIEFNQKKPATYGYLNERKLDFETQNNNPRKQTLYQQLLNDQKESLKNINPQLAKDFENIQRLSMQKERLQAQAQSLFGKDLDQSFINKLNTSTLNLAKGNTDSFIKLIENSSIPKNMRGEIVASSLAKAFSKKEGLISFRDYNNFYEGLQKNKSGQESLFKYLPKDAKQKLDDLYTLSKRIDIAQSSRVYTGLANDIKKQLENANLFQKVYSLVKNNTGRTIGALAGSSVFGGGFIGAILGGIVGNLGKNKNNIVAEADKFLSSHEFLTGLTDILEGKEQQGLEAIAKSSAFNSFIKKTNINKKLDFIKDNNLSEKSKIALIRYILSDKTDKQDDEELTPIDDDNTNDNELQPIED
jgi:hypothetical protein